MSWDAGTFIPPPTPAPGGMTMDEILDSRTPRPDPEALAARRSLERRYIAAASRESILLGRVRQLEKALANMVEPKA